MKIDLGEIVVGCLLVLIAYQNLFKFFDLSRLVACQEDAKAMNTVYEYRFVGGCYIKEGDKFYPEGMLKHVTVGDEDFES